MRAFVAVPAAERLTAAATTALDGCRERLDVRWTHPSTWHLTLQFLGEWPAERLNALETALREVSDLDRFSLRCTGLGAFPNMRAPRVLFLHLEGDGALERLAEQVRRTVAGIWPDGPQDTKPFRGHLTVARVPRRLARDELDALRDIDLTDLPEFPVEEFRLVSSELTPGGPRHSDLARFALRKKGE